MGVKYRMPEHPGIALKEEVIDPIAMSIRQFAKALRVPPNRLAQIVAGKRAISADTSLRLARYLGCSPDFWLNLQTRYELELAKRQSLNRIRREVKPRSKAAA